MNANRRTKKRFQNLIKNIYSFIKLPLNHAKVKYTVKNCYTKLKSKFLLGIMKKILHEILVTLAVLLKESQAKLYFVSKVDVLCCLTCLEYVRRETMIYDLKLIRMLRGFIENVWK